MVLEGATNSNTAPSDSFADNAYPSDADPYSASDGSAQQYSFQQINLNDFPQPPLIIGALVGYSRTRAAMTLSANMQAAAHLLRRPLTEDEAKGLAYHIMTAERRASCGASAGAALAMARCYQTRNDFKFPFWKPSSASGWNPDSLGPLRGQVARTAYHLLRIPPYWFMGAFLAGMLSQAYSGVMATIAVSQDQRLKELSASISKVSKQAAHEAVRRQGGRVGGQPPPNAPDPSAPSQTGGQDSWDDMSPTSGARHDYIVDSGPQSPPDSARNAASPWSQGSQGTQSRSYDDASPTGGLGPMDAGPPSAGGSAWDRVRQQASSGQGPPTGPAAPWARSAQEEQRTGSTLGDNFTFSSSNEERQLAKAEAQKDFDARIEQERRGAGFNEGGKRW